MKLRRIVYLGLFSTISVISAGCVNLQPFVRDFNVISISQEIEMGKEMSSQIHQEMKIVEDAAINKKVKDIGNQLVKALPSIDFPYQFYVVEDPSPNAFNIPGGSVYVHTGLLKFTTNDELAGVIAHELGHAYERHTTNSISRAYGVQTLTGLLMRNNTNQLKSIALELAKGGLLTKYGRDDEREADEIGFLFLGRAGMNTNGLLSFLRKLEKLQQGSSGPQFLSSHPSTPERIERLEALEDALLAQSSIENHSPQNQS